MEQPRICCSYMGQNNQCIGKLCPFCKKKKKIAFICVHNSCRSQIAEALGRKYLSDFCECYSAGTETKPRINPDAVRLMKQEYGIDMEKDQYSKLIRDIPEVDLYVSMGCNVACPNIPRQTDGELGPGGSNGKGRSDFSGCNPADRGKDTAFKRMGRQLFYNEIGNGQGAASYKGKRSLTM